MTFPLRTAIVPAAALAALSFAAAAPARGADLGACFTTHDIRQTVRADARHVNLSTRDGRYFQITTKNDCRSGSVTDPLVINTGGGSGLICRPVDITLASGAGSMSTPCLVDSITPLSKDQMAAMPAGQRAN